MMKAKEQFDEVKRKFDLINTELHDELPALYNSRVLFLITNLQPYFAAEQLFHSESSKVRKTYLFIAPLRFTTFNTGIQYYRYGYTSPGKVVIAL